MMLKEYYSLEAEQSVLGSLIGENNADCLTVAELRHTDFFLSKHRWLFKAIETLLEKDVPPDIVGVTTWLTNANLIHEFEMTELFEMMEAANPQNFKYHQKIIKDHARRRTVQRTLARMQEKFLEHGDIEELEELVAKGVDLLTQTTMNDAITFTHIGDITYDVFEHINSDTGQIKGVPTGFTELDKMTNGLHEGDFIVIGARPSMGKTAFALNIAMGAATAGAKVPIFSLEMSNDSLGIRMLAAKSRVDSKRIKQGKTEISDKDWTQLGLGGGELSALDIMVSDKSFVTVHQIKQELTKMRKMHPNTKIVCIIDYLQLVQGGPKYAGNRQQEVSEISRILKTTAKDNKITIIALSQLSRGVEQRQDKRPMMSDLRESGSIEQDADVIGFLYREEYYDRESPNKNIIECILTKNREGEVGSVELAFLKEFGVMINLERRFDN